MTGGAGFVGAYLVAALVAVSLSDTPIVSILVVDWGLSLSQTLAS